MKYIPTREKPFIPDEDDEEDAVPGDKLALCVALIIFALITTGLL